MISSRGLRIFVASALVVLVSTLCYGDVAVSIKEKFKSDGSYTFNIFESGKGPTGRYTRSYTFHAKVVQGIALPADFADYIATMQT